MYIEIAGVIFFILLYIFLCADCACGCKLATCVVNMKHNYCKEPYHVNKRRHVTLYYADWCPHCVTAMTIWDSIATQDIGITFIKINSDDVKDPNLRVPTIRMIDEFGHTSQYEGIIQYEKLLRWLQAPH
jgi:thiol-disulfide isomerase/thioredoxin